MISSQQEATPIGSAGASSQRHGAWREHALVSRSFGLTDRGKVRPANEDQFLIATLARALWIQQSSLPQQPVRYADAEGLLLVVADGMGGVAGGALASALALGAIEDFLLTSLSWLFGLDGPAEGGELEVLEQFEGALRRADARVCDAASRHPELTGMGTTLTMAYAHGSELFVAHVGDSRCYLLRGGGLHQLTRDHTWVQDMVESGVLPPENAPHHELRHIVTNAVGGPRPGVRVEVHKVDLMPGDVLLLCTDGLTEMVPNDDILVVVRDELDPRAACERLVQLANDRGGRDNVTAVVARYERPATPPPARAPQAT
jgi:protein phosphatase